MPRFAKLKQGITAPFFRIKQHIFVMDKPSDRTGYFALSGQTALLRQKGDTAAITVVKKKQRRSKLMKIKMKKIFGILLSLALVLGLMPGMSLTAKAIPVETLLTTVTFTNDGSQTHSTDGVVTVTIHASRYDNENGWLFGSQSGDVTVTPVDGVVLTKVRFIQNAKNPLDDDEAPFELRYTYNPYEQSLSGATVGTSNGAMRSSQMNGVTSIEVYGYNTVEEYTVTYKVINGTWDGNSTADKTESVASGASPASVPAGMKADSGYTGGSWDQDPASTTITADTIFTYTFVAKEAATVTTAPAAKTLTYNGEAQELVTAGTATGGTMQYALGTDATTAPANNLYTTSIPTATDAGTYYVYFKVVGDENHNDSAAGYVEVVISPEQGGTNNPDDHGSSDNTGSSDKSVIMSRLYNPNSGEHLYTKSEREKKALVGAGWTYEGPGWTAPEKGDPVYRLYNENSGDHHFTMSTREKNSLIKAGWKDEGIGWYSAPKDGGKPLYRLYNPNCSGAGSHHYTTSTRERDKLKQAGWEYEGIAWYGIAE